MRKRLEELNWRTHSLDSGDHGAIVEVVDFSLGEVLASPPVSLKAQQKKKIA
jgi:hypothetical protein